MVGGAFTLHFLYYSLLMFEFFDHVLLLLWVCVQKLIKNEALSRLSKNKFCEEYIVLFKKNDQHKLLSKKGTLFVLV